MKRLIVVIALMMAICSGSTFASVDTTSWIVLSVKAGANIKMVFKSFNESANVWVVSGKDTTFIEVGEYFREKTVKASTSWMKIYGYISTFVCGNNGENINGIDVSKNPNLWGLNCNNNAISSLDVSKLIQLRALHCERNKLTDLDVSKNDELGLLNCGFNPLSSLNLDELDRLQELYCNKTQLKQLNLTNNKQLKILSCAGNELTSLNLKENPLIQFLNISTNKISKIDIQHLTRLNKIIFCENAFSTFEIDRIFCSLPPISSNDSKCFPVNTNTDPQYQATLASNTKNATDKGWRVLLYGNGYHEEIVGTGNFNCSTGINELTYSGISVFPNPANSKVEVRLGEKVNETIILVDLIGRAVLTADLVAGKVSLDLSNLTVGTYFIRVGNRVQKLTVK